ncbi:MAG TPA: MFS transporter [Candidatus Paceibacterota bacterium]|nr:MFS transporter [Verrucomicrobiota bacterium]HSA09511.1 MFS transporter [Candidatus Paceibacterota bacterium]
MNAHDQHRTRTLWLTGLLHGFTHVYQVVLIPLYLLIQRDLKLTSVDQATLLMTVMMAACFAPSYPIGVLADRMDRKKLLGFGLALNGLAFVALALAPNYAWTLVAVAAAGFGGSFYHPAATAMVARLYPGSRGKALGLVGIGASVGFFVGPIYAGWRAGLLEPVLGPAAWRRPVLELGLLGIAVAALFYWLADDEQPAPAAERNSDRAGRMFPTPALWIFFLLYCLAFSVRDFAGSSMGSLSSLFLQNARNYDPKWTGLALSGMFVAAIISNPLFGHLSDRGRKRWIALVLTVAAAAMAVFPHVPSGWTLPVLLVYGFFFMASYPMTEAALMDSVPDAVRGRAFGLFVMGGGVIGNLSHWAVGAKVRLLGPAAHTVSAYFPIYLAVALLTLASLTGLLCLRAIQRREGPVTSAARPDSMPLLT